MPSEPSQRKITTSGARPGTQISPPLGEGGTSRPPTHNFKRSLHVDGHGEDAAHDLH